MAMVLMIISDGCVEKLEVPVTGSIARLVVDGFITDDPGPYRVRLFLSAPMTSDVDRPVYVSGAVVTIRDDQGNEEQLTEIRQGVYETHPAGIRGVVGRSYQLAITTAEEKQYSSGWEKMTPAGEVQDLYFEFKENVINANDLSLPQDAFTVFVDARGDEASSGLLRWRWTGTYRIKTFPELHERFDDVARAFVPDPLPCSGYIFDVGQLIQVDTCVCCDCWLKHFSGNALVSDPAYVQGRTFRRVQIAQIPVDKKLFYEKYHIEVEQLSLGEEVYRFWHLLDVQEESTGNIFQPNIVKVKGNVVSITDPEEEVFGIFAVSAIARKSIFINRSDIPKLVPPIDVVKGDCRQYPTADNIEPPFW